MSTDEEVDNGEEECDPSVVFSMTMYPEGINLVNAPPSVFQIIKTTTETNFPKGIKEVKEDDQGSGQFIKLNCQSGRITSSGTSSSNFLYSNRGKLLCCQLLSSLRTDGWEMIGNASLDSMCIYNLPEELYPSTTWFFQRTLLDVHEQTADEDEEVYEEEEDN